MSIFRAKKTVFNVGAKTHTTVLNMSRQCTITKNTYVAVCYYLNRTWECFEYQNVIRKLYRIISNELKVKAVDEWKAAKGKKRISTTERERIYKDIDALFKESFKEIEQQPAYSYVCND